MKSQIWESEDSIRKDYISDKFRKVFNISHNDSLDIALSKILNIKKNDIQNIEQKDMLNYFNGEQNKDKLLKGIVKEIKKTKTEKKKEYYKIKSKFYNYNNYQKSSNYGYGYIKGSKTKVYIEKQLINGKLQIRLRDKKGRFANFLK